MAVNKVVFCETEVFNISLDSIGSTDTNAILYGAKILAKNGEVITGTAFQNKPLTQKIPVYSTNNYLGATRSYPSKIIYKNKTITDLHSIGISNATADYVRYKARFHDQNGISITGTFLKDNPDTYNYTEPLTTSTGTILISGANSPTNPSQILFEMTPYKKTSTSTKEITYTRQN